MNFFSYIRIYNCYVGFLNYVQSYIFYVGIVINHAGICNCCVGTWNVLKKMYKYLKNSLKIKQYR